MGASVPGKRPLRGPRRASPGGGSPSVLPTPRQGGTCLDFLSGCLLDTEDGDSEGYLVSKQPSAMARWPGCGMAPLWDGPDL